MHERVLPLQGAHPVKQAEDLAPSARLGRGDELLAETRHDCGDVVGLPRVRGQPFELLHGHALGVPVPEPRQRLQRLVLEDRILARHVGGCFRATIRTFVDADVSSRVRVFDGAPPTTAEVRQPPRVVSQGRLGGRNCLNWLPKVELSKRVLSVETEARPPIATPSRHPIDPQEVRCSTVR